MALPAATAETAPSETPRRFCEGILLNKTPFPSLVRGAGSSPDGYAAHLHPSVRTTQGSSRYFLSLVPTPECAHTEFIYFSFRTILFKQDLISLAHVSLLQAHKSLTRLVIFLRNYLSLTNSGEGSLSDEYNYLHHRAHGPWNNLNTRLTPSATAVFSDIDGPGWFWAT